jgi:hypothetical protein
MTLDGNVNLQRGDIHVDGINDSLCHTAQSSEEMVSETAPVHEKGGVAGEVELDVHKGVCLLAII